MGMFDALSITASGMTAERVRMDVIAENLANADTTVGPNGKPYQRQDVVLQQASPSFGEVLGGVQVAGIVSDTTPPHMVYDPGNPEANKQGYVAMPNVNPVSEMVDLITSTRGYEADVTAMNAAKQMFTNTLQVLK